MAMPIFAYGKVRPLRQAKHLSQAEIAAELGISRPTYALMEQGQKEPTLTQLYTLARLLGVEPGVLCTNLPAAGARIADYPKFKELAALCAYLSGGKDGVTKTKLSILAYLADFAWHFKTGSPMTGEIYRYSPRGPVAEDFFRALEEMYESQAVAIEPAGSSLVIRPIEPPRGKLLGDDQRQLAEKVCAKWQKAGTEEILAFAQQRLEPRSPKPGQPIPYESIMSESEQLLY